MMDNPPPKAGVPVVLAEGLTCVLAPNPSPMTYWGTNTFLVGTKSLAIIDPGPQSDAHLAALLAAIGGRSVSHIIVTHSHLDHSPLARPLADATGAPVLAFGASDAGRSDVMQSLADVGLAGGGEGVDIDFVPDHIVADGDIINGDGWALDVIHTPGHMGNHIALGWGDAVFTGDHVMGWASSLVSPPDGNLTHFMTSIERLMQRPARIFYSAHGDPITNPMERLRWLRDHRLSREAQILAALGNDAADVESLTHAVYCDIAPQMLPAAARNVFAHLVDLHGRGLVDATPRLATTAAFQRSFQS